MALLEVEGLSVSYFVLKKEFKAVEDVSFELEEQQTLGVVGESGSGKSTLGLALLRLIPPQGKIVGGRVLIEGEDVTSFGREELRKVRGRKIAMIFQDPMTSLNPLMNVGDHFVEAIQAHFPDATREEGLEKARTILGHLNISEERLKDYPHQLSGGMKQRIMIGLGLALEPKLLIADEPTTALDVVIEAQILELLRQLKESLRLSMILITHNLGVVAQVADRIAIMYGGEIMELADAKVLFKRPLFPYTKLLLKLVPNILTDSTHLEWIPGSPPDLSLRYQGCKFAARCPSVFARCRVEAPKLREVESGHFVACHLY